MGTKRLGKLKIGRVLISLVLFIYVAVILYPLFWMLMSSLKGYNEIYSNVWDLPQNWLFSNYVTAWQKGISDYFLNSLIVTGTTIVLVAVVASLCAYGLSRYHFKGKTFVFLLCAGGMMINPQVCLVPLYRLLQGLGVHNTLFALILLYVAFRLSLSVLLLRSYFLGIPEDLVEAAQIDGCSSWGIYARIYMPLARPILLTTAMLTAYYAWNEFLFAIIFIDSNKYKTIPSGLMNFRDALQTDWGVLLAGMVISTLPMIIMLVSLQKHLVRGMAEGAAKG